MSGRNRQMSYDITYVWDLNNYTNELIYKTEMHSETENKHGILDF